MKPAPDGRHVKLRAWWSHRQALDGRLAGASPSVILRETGWARSVGGVSPYLTLFARAGASREEADATVRGLEIHEIPAARGCTYVVPACDFAVALKAAQNMGDGDMAVARKLGVTDKEIDKLCAAVLKSLKDGPLEPGAIRAATGAASRGLGEEGKKKGVTTTLPLALGRLQVEGEIRRVPTNGRLDQQRYAYTLWRPNPLDGVRLSPAEVNVELARRYFTWTGPATLKEFQWFSALSVAACKAAFEPLGLVPVEGDRQLLPEHSHEFEAFAAPEKAQYVLVGSIDGISLLRRDLISLLDPADLERQVHADKGLKPLSGIADLPSHGILDRGRLVGLWEYDTATESIAWTAFISKNREMETAVKRTEEFVRAQLGDARSFSLDSPKSRAPRIAALRA